MIQLNILSGKTAGTQLVARRFPFHVGRAPGNELQLEDDGVWDQHLTLEFNPQSGFTLITKSGALVTVNGDPVKDTTLRNGDTLTIGSVKLQLWVAAATHDSLLIRESLVWTLLALVTLGQFVLVYWLIR
jgi:pSer/pThr/pTyr-binding forkhead associated (FHA) protein